MCPEVVVVPAGSFLMGSAASSDPDMYIEEAPQHRVTIARPFAVGKFEITVDQFSAFVNETGYDTGSKCWTAEDGNTEQERTGRSFKNPGFAQDGSHPAVCLNWTDAKTYTEWLSKKTGRPYRLLTEAEWEYSARAGTATTYHFGNNRDELCQHGNGLDRTAKRSLPNASEWAIAECEDGFAHTAPVGRFAANAFGLHDFHGNVWELTEDCWNWSYNGAPADGSAWLGGRCNPGVRRGGSWRSHPKMLRSANRIDGHSTNRYDTIGIRIGRTLLAP
jgi:formylglycine-generating enzyme required for sulfatase activity